MESTLRESCYCSDVLVTYCFLAPICDAYRITRILLSSVISHAALAQAPGHATRVDLNQDEMPLPTALPEKRRDLQLGCTYVGVSKFHMSFRALIWLPDKSKAKHLGNFSTAKEAAHAYDDAVRQVGILSTVLLRVTGCLQTFLCA